MNIDEALLCIVDWADAVFSRCFSVEKIAHDSSFSFHRANTFPLGGAWHGMVCSLAASWARQTGLQGEVLLLLVYCSFSRKSLWLDRLALR